MLGRLRRERGQELVEYALILPILLFLLLAIVQLGLIVFSFDTISHAARDACRWGVVEARADTRLADIEAHAREFTRAAGMDDALVTARATKVNASTLRVEVTYRMPMLTFLSSSPSIDLTAASTKRIELD